MSTKRYADEVKAEAAGQVLDIGDRVADVAQRLGVGQHSLWVAVPGGCHRSVVTHGRGLVHGSA
ncbi:transposase [Piscinibacter sakaiensis]|uniref:transposase n=1 Tax=Piscinibacter sakaiensis TaxID=1547922 RepID=UPI003AAD30C5